MKVSAYPVAHAIAHRPSIRTGRRYMGKTAAALRLAISARIGPRRVVFLRRHLRAAHAMIRPALRDLSVAVLDAPAMRDLHRRFLGLPGVTDVLSFELAHDSRGRVTTGEIAICFPVARLQARHRRLPLDHELLLYALHGLLHLCGFDDRTPSASRIMHAKEDQLLIRLGIGPVFGSPPAGESRPKHGAGRCPST
ncbi:MAG: rRNA maturation RNase YbeY [Tepidisphaeraceae bacterium]